MIKSLIKHGWPVKFEKIDRYQFQIKHHDLPETPADMLNAIEIVARIVARTYRLDITYFGDGVFIINRNYEVRNCHFRETTK